jgi:hypothetical protein
MLRFFLKDFEDKFGSIVLKISTLPISYDCVHTTIACR